MSVRLLRASNLSPVRLGPMIGKGGEGDVFPVRAAPNLVAKLYRKPPGQLKAQKLFAMVRMASPALLRVAAWPVDVVLDESRTVRGFLMQKVTAREDVHELYSPKSRKRAFPRADFRFIVRAATNVARAFAQMHAQGHVIGDVNHGNALVGLDATVVLIDCDSFQVRDRVRTYTCDVGVPLFTAPELQGKAFRGLRRAADHDAFGLAVLLFHLLFLGRHPFAGRHSGGEMPIERAIAESRFAYGYAAASFGMSPPPGTLPLQSFGPQIAALFERTFAPPGGANRPTATDWIAALQQLEQELEPCALSRSHFHCHGANCCWCEMEDATGVPLFGEELRTTQPVAAVALESLWNAIVAVPRPASQRAEPTPGKTKINPQYPRRRKIKTSLLCAAALTIACLYLIVDPGAFFPYLAPLFLGFAAALVLASLFNVRRWRPDPHLQAAEERWRDVIERWRRECSTERFDKALSELSETRKKLASLLVAREEQSSPLEARQRQRERHLQRFRIANAAFRKVRPTEMTKLVLLGIETAADVARERSTLVDTVSGPAALELLAWYRACAKQFQFDPREPDVADWRKNIQQARHTRKQQQLIERLCEGPALLERKQEEIARTRARMQRSVDEAWDALVEARERARGRG